MLNLFNSLTLKKAPFKPADDFSVKMYTCGPSTYQRTHIGNYRTFLFEDVLQRYLEYLGYSVNRLITLTDIEDKAIIQAEKEGVSVEKLTARNEEVFFRNFALLRIKCPDYTARASGIVDQAVMLIEELLEKKVIYRYVHEGRENIYFDPLKFAGFGRLANLDMKCWPKKKRRFHRDTYSGTPWNRGDFVVWHGCGSEDKVCWQTRIGMGRPSWNIQDAAIVTKHLGFQIDLACGGIDNLVRHHDYTLAITESVSGKPFAGFWVHGGHLLMEGKKMSKSKSNVLYPEDLLSRGYIGAQIRFFLIYGPYGKRRNFTWEKLSQSSNKLLQLSRMIDTLNEVRCQSSCAEAKEVALSIIPSFEKAMNDNLDVKTAFDLIYFKICRLCDLSRKGKVSSDVGIAAVSAIRRVDSVLQVVF